MHAEIVDLTRRHLCAQASSATLEHVFSKVVVIVSKKRQRLTANYVDGINFMGWHYKDNRWGELLKRRKCGTVMEWGSHLDL